MLPLRTILHPTDFSERSRAAFQMACVLAKDYGARVLVLHVGMPPIVAYGFEGVLPSDTEAYALEANTQLRQLQSNDPEVLVEHCLVLERDPVPEILRQAGEAHCELIVMGTHGRTGLWRTLMGSVAEQVVRKAACPVLTVKMPFAKKESAKEGSARPADLAMESKSR
jgi:nucleotide-binding universal stress UspA family protein